MGSEIGMNGSDDDRETCRNCSTKRGHASDSSYDHPRFTGRHYRGDWYCDACWVILAGTQRIKALATENRRLSRRVAWFEGLLKPRLLTRIFRRFFTRRAYVDRLEEKLKTILAHAGSSIECVDEPAAGYLRDICEIVDEFYGEDTSETQDDCSSCGGIDGGDGYLMPLSYEEGAVPCPKCNPKGKG